MNFSMELGILIAISLVGLVTALQSLRYAQLNYQAVVDHPETDPELVEGRRRIRTTQILLAVGWAGWVLLGLVATIPTPPPAPVGSTPIGQVIRYLLLGSLALWSWFTVSEFWYSRGKWRQQYKRKGDS